MLLMEYRLQIVIDSKVLILAQLGYVSCLLQENQTTHSLIYKTGFVETTLERIYELTMSHSQQLKQ